MQSIEVVSHMLLCLLVISIIFRYMNYNNCSVSEMDSRVIKEQYILFLGVVAVIKKITRIGIGI